MKLPDSPLRSITSTWRRKFITFGALRVSVDISVAPGCLNQIEEQWESSTWSTMVTCMHPWNTKSKHQKEETTQQSNPLEAITAAFTVGNLPTDAWTTFMDACLNGSKWMEFYSNGLISNSKCCKVQVTVCCSICCCWKTPPALKASVTSAMSIPRVLIPSQQSKQAKDLRHPLI